MIHFLPEGVGDSVVFESWEQLVRSISKNDKEVELERQVVNFVAEVLDRTGFITPKELEKWTTGDGVGISKAKLYVRKILDNI